MNPIRVLLGVAIVPLALTMGCALIATATGSDPMLVVEMVMLITTTAWLVLIGLDGWRAAAQAASLSDRSRPIELAGSDVRLLDVLHPAAFVTGLFRPRIYVSLALIEILDERELRGVLLHEQHHRRTRAPLRALALQSWRRLLDWLPPARRVLGARLAALEIEADASAVARGIAPATLASALLKIGSDAPGAPCSSRAFTSGAEVRIGELVAWGRKLPADRHGSIPVEWAAPASLVFALLACHLVGA